MKFLLGTHRPSWLARTDIPLFVSRRTMPKTALPRALGPWALDSGGFSEIQLYGKWTLEPERYSGEVFRFHDEIGKLEWAAVQDWMCEPFMVQRTGLSVAIHQQRTVESYLKLRDLWPEGPWAPVLQGWTLGGSVCRRQNTISAGLILAELRDRGLENLHGFGFKVSGLTSIARTSVALGRPMLLASADSLAWSYQARREPPLPECRGHINCANCLRFALDWRDRLLRSVERAEAREQASLFA